MAVSEILNSLGSFDLSFSSTVPREILDELDYFGHIVIVPGRVDTVQAGDNSLTAARYVGVLRSKKIGDDARTNEVGDSISVGGVGVAFWLGDDDSDRGKGAIFETAQNFTSSTFANTVRALLPDAVSEGTLHSVAGTFSGQFVYETPRTAIQYVCDTMSTDSVPVGWRVNGDGSLDAGPETDLYVTSPVCVVVRKGFGEDMSMRALEGSMDIEQDMEDFTTRVVLLAEGEGSTVATGAADISTGLNPFKDLHGNSLKMTRLVSESDTSTGNAESRAQLQLNRFTGTRDALTLSASDYDVHGSFQVGDYIWVYDPDAGLVDTNNEIIFRGERLNPIRLQVHETSWSITDGYSVGYRASSGTWYDLTDYVDFETDSSSKITVGEFSRTLSVASGEVVGTRPNADTSTPDVPDWVEPFTSVNYQDDLGVTHVKVLLSWNAPNNVDGSTVLDGDHYEIQVRLDGDELAHWQTYYVAWGESSSFINDLSTGTGYDVRIRLVDTSGNMGEYADTTFFTTQDNIAPSDPAAPTVAASRIAIQVTHQLGKSSGGTFNLEADLHHLEVHVGSASTFTPASTTLKGTVTANQGMMVGSIPAVETFNVEETTARWVKVVAVDIAGNKSNASAAASATALLIDNAHISDLTVSKVTAGTISANWVVGARLATALTGPRVELNTNGIQAFNSAGTQTVDVASATGNVTISGTFRTTTSNSGSAIVISQSNSVGEMRFYSGNGTTYGRIFSLDESATGTSDASVKMISSYDTSGIASFTGNLQANWVGGRMAPDDDFIYRFAGGGIQATNNSVWVGYSSDPDVYDTGLGMLANATNTRIFYHDGQSDEAGFQLYSGHTAHYGKWYSGAPDSSTSGIYCGTVSFSTDNVTSATINYGLTAASPFYPQAMLRDDAGRDGIFMTAGGDISTTSFTLSWATPTNASFGIHFWAYRI